MLKHDAEVSTIAPGDLIAIDWLRRYKWLRSDDRTFEEWDAMRTLYGITLDAYIDQKMGYDHE